MIIVLGLVINTGYKKIDKDLYVEAKIKNIYNLTLPKLINPLDWVIQQQGYSLINKDKLWIVPNIQQLVKNLIIKDVKQGYVNQIEVRNKLNNYLYHGEGQLTIYSLNGVVPSNFFVGLWKGFLGLFGGSFIDAPSKETFNTLTSLNNDYISRENSFINDMVGPLEILHKKLSVWESFEKDYVSQEDLDNAKSKISQIEYNGMRGKEAYDFVVNKREKYLNSNEYNYKTLDGILFGENGYSGNREYFDLYFDYIKNSMDLFAEVKLLPDFKTYKYPVNEVIGNTELNVIELYEKYGEVENRYQRFIKRFNASGKNSFSQCLIKSKEKGKCKDNKFGKEASYFIGNVHVLSGASANFKDGVNKESVIRYLNKVREYTGAYYSEVLGNLLHVLNDLHIERYKTPLKLEHNVIRQMPYDRDNLIDKHNFPISDKRNDVFKQHFMGQIFSNYWANPSSVLFYFKLEPYIVNFIGDMANFTILLNKIISFEVFENAGLNPTALVEGGILTFVMYAILILFIYHTLKHTLSLIRGKKGKGFVRLLFSFLLLLFELGAIYYVNENPQRAWETVKKPMATVLNIGEGFYFRDGEFDYLIPTPSDIYKLNYYDGWSRYNVGYGLKDKENFITLGVPEAEKLRIPSMNNKLIKHWSMLLADSFNYYGESSDITALNHNGKLINGTTINLNAYRVVDHFLAPRIKIKTVDKDTKAIEVKENENFNGKFQNNLYGLLPNVVTSFILLLLVVIKLSVFIYFFFNLYMIAYRIIIDKIKEKKSWGELFKHIFAPILHMIAIGLISNFVIHSTMIIRDTTISLLFQIGLLFVLKGIFIWWSEQRDFPNILKPLVWLLTFGKQQDRVKLENIETDFETEMQQSELVFEKGKEYETLFDERGNRKHYGMQTNKAYQEYVKLLIQKRENGIKLTKQEEEAIIRIKGVDVARDKDRKTKATSSKIKGE